MNTPAVVHSIQRRIPSDLNAARAFQFEIEHALQKADFTEHDIFAIKLAVEEALVNAIKHGNRLDPAKHVRVNCRVCSGRFEVHIADEGAGFDPDAVPDPTAPENLERPCGRGLLLMRHYMTEVHFHDCGRSVRMAKVIDA
jgi:serine/threonine-protein kinase RsbW